MATSHDIKKTCTSCHLPYNKSERVPLIFPECKHVRCMSCIKKSIVDDELSMFGKVVICPTCLLPHHPHHGLIDGSFLIAGSLAADMLDHILSDVKEEPGVDATERSLLTVKKESIVDTAEHPLLAVKKEPTAKRPRTNKIPDANIGTSLNVAEDVVSSVSSGDVLTAVPTVRAVRFVHTKSRPAPRKKKEPTTRKRVERKPPTMKVGTTRFVAKPAN